MSKPTLFGPDGKPAIDIKTDRDSQKVWEIGNVKSPPLPSNPEELAEAFRQAAEANGVQLAMNVITPLGIMAWQATSMFSEAITKRVSELEKGQGEVSRRKKLERELSRFKEQLFNLELELGQLKKRLGED